MAEVIIALDLASRAGALRMVERLGDAVDFYKVGLELYAREGPALVQELRARNKRVFLDLKLHDIPTAVAGAVRAAADLDISMLTVHAAGGSPMMEAAADAAANRLALLGVTLLTSLSRHDVEATWGRTVVSLPEEVVRLADLARNSGLHGVVASPREARAVRYRFGEGFLLVTPGIRFPDAALHDQARVATPAEAVHAGASHLVLGRVVTAAPEPAVALERVWRSLEESGAAGLGR